MRRVVPAAPWRSQPQTIAQIDWSNPVTRGLIGCYMGSGSDPARNLASPLNQFTPSGSGASRTGTASGIGYALDGASYLQDQNFPDVGSGRTLLALINPASLPASNANVMVWSQSATTSELNQLSFDSAGRVGVDCYRNGTAGRATTTGAVTLNKWQVVAAIYPSDASRSACLDNEIATTVNTALPQFVVGNWLTLGYAPWAGVDFFTGGVALSLVWGRGITDAEYQSVVKNPWQVFAPLLRRIWVGVSAGGGGTFLPQFANQSGKFIGVGIS